MDQSRPDIAASADGWRLQPRLPSRVVASPQPDNPALWIAACLDEPGRLFDWFVDAAGRVGPNGFRSCMASAESGTAPSTRSIINVSSVHADIPNAGGADYDCSKGAIRMLTRTLALELAPLKINVNSLAPGMVLMPFNQRAIDDPDLLDEQVQSIPWKRAADPSEIARLAVFLASSDADYVTGSTYTMDGGLSRNLGQGA